MCVCGVTAFVSLHVPVSMLALGNQITFQKRRGVPASTNPMFTAKP